MDAPPSKPATLILAPTLLVDQHDSLVVAGHCQSTREVRQRTRAERLSADREMQHAQREYEAFNVDGCKQLLAACDPAFRKVGMALLERLVRTIAMAVAAFCTGCTNRRHFTRWSLRGHRLWSLGVRCTARSSRLGSPRTAIEVHIEGPSQLQWSTMLTSVQMASICYLRRVAWDTARTPIWWRHCLELGNRQTAHAL